MIDVKFSTVADIVNANPQSATVFKKYKIDFCCKGKQPLNEACKKAGVTPESVLDEINQLAKQPGTNMRIHSWANEMICDYIVNNHHNYVRNVTPQIEALSYKVASVHGENHPELIQVYHTFAGLAKELMAHLNKEEEDWFPAIKSGKVSKKLINEIEEEHDEAGGLMAEINELTDGYQPPHDACTSYRVLFDLLKEFEDDLHQHVHVENNILIPKIKHQIKS